MTMNLEQFVEAENFFDGLREMARSEKENYPFPVSPRGADLYFGIAALAVAVLYRAGETRLKELAKKDIVNSSIAEGTLDIAMNAIGKYMLDQKGGFDRYTYEQLARACYSARRLLEKERG